MYICLLGDFGIAQDTSKESEFSFIDGDWRYLAPELKTWSPKTGEILKKADIYAAGLIFLQLALGMLWSIGILSFESKSKKIKEEFEDLDKMLLALDTTTFSTSFKSVIRQCLEKDPAIRSTSRSLLSGVKSCINKAEIHILELFSERAQMRTLSSPGPLIKLYLQKKSSKESS